LEKRVAPVVALAADTVADPETVKVLEGESSERLPVVVTVTPVKVVVLLMLKVMGVVAALTIVLCDSGPLVPVMLIV
jgi:hypothetical protein